MSEGQPSSADARLVRAIGTWGLAASIVNVTVGGGIFRLPASPEVTGRLGAAAPVAYLVCAVVMGLIVLCIAEAGYFYRSDHFSFAKAGIPAVSIGAGDDYVGRPSGWGAQQDDDYTAHRYHQPSDAYRSDFNLAGAVQLSEIVLRFATRLANAAGVPTWNRDAEFRAARTAAQP